MGAIWVGSLLRVTPSVREPEPIFFELVEEAAPSAENPPPAESPPTPEPVPATEPSEEPEPEIRQEAVAESPSEPSPVPMATPEPEAVSRDEEIVAPTPSPPPPPPPATKPTRASEAPAPASAPVERAKVLSAPQALNRLTPVYPRSARRKGREGTVVVEAVVRESGSVESAQVVSTSGFADLDGAAVKAVRKAEFAPAREDGVAVSGRIRLTFEFRLGGE